MMQSKTPLSMKRWTGKATQQRTFTLASIQTLATVRNADMVTSEAHPYA